MILIPVGLAILLALVYLKTEPNRYMGVARLTVTPAGSRFSGDTSDSMLMSNFLATQAEKIMSREVLALALSQPVGDEVDSSGAPVNQIRGLATFKNSDEPPLVQMKNFVSVTPGRKDDALSVGFEAPVKADAAVIANAIVHAFIKYQTQPKDFQSTTSGVLDAHRAEKKKVETELTQVTDKMGAMEQKYGILSRAGEDNLAVRQYNLLSQQLADAHRDTIKAQTDLDEASRIHVTDPRLLTNSNAADAAIASAEDEGVLRTELQQQQNKLEDAKQHYLPDHPVVRALQKKYEQMAVSYIEAVRRRLLRCKTIENDLKAQFDDQTNKANDVNRQAAAYNDLKDHAEELRHVDETLDTRIHAIELQQSAGAVDVDFFDPADPTAVRRSHPSGSRALGMALALGLIIGCGLALTRDWMDDRLHSADEIKSSLGLPMLGAIPQMSHGNDPAVAGQTVVFEPGGVVAEGYRSIRTALYFGAPKDRSKTILITSPVAGDGKSTTAANLAAVIAQAGKKILLIDADLRNPSIHMIFNLRDNRVGLSSLLSGQGTWERAIQRSPIDGLDLLPSGPKPKNPSEMLNSPMFGELLEMLAEKYDQIIIDSPPVLGVGDARIIAANADLTILVLRAEKSTRKVATVAREGLAGVGAHLLGIIVNDVGERARNQFGGAYSYPTRAAKAAMPIEDPEETNGHRTSNGGGRSDIVVRPPRNGH